MTCSSFPCVIGHSFRQFWTLWYFNFRTCVRWHNAYGLTVAIPLVHQSIVRKGVMSQPSIFWCPTRNLIRYCNKTVMTISIAAVLTWLRFIRLTALAIGFGATGTWKKVKSTIIKPESHSICLRNILLWRIYTFKCKSTTNWIRHVCKITNLPWLYTIMIYIIRYDIWYDTRIYSVHNWGCGYCHLIYQISIPPCDLFLTLTLSDMTWYDVILPN